MFREDEKTWQCQPHEFRRVPWDDLKAEFASKEERATETIQLIKNIRLQYA